MRLFGLDLAFATDDNRPPAHARPAAANATFVPLFDSCATSYGGHGEPAQRRGRETGPTTTGSSGSPSSSSTSL